MSARQAERAAPLPRTLTVGRSPSERARVREFWERLSTAERRDLAALCAPREDPTERSLLRVRARFFDEARRDDRLDDASRDPRRDHDYGGRLGSFPIDFYEYAHENDVFLKTRTFHICTQHEAAAAAVRSGVIPATFTCPLARPDCPMRRALSVEPGRSLRLLSDPPLAAQQDMEGDEEPMEKPLEPLPPKQGLAGLDGAHQAPAASSSTP